jgi:hypothetical protein
VQLTPCVASAWAVRLQKWRRAECCSAEQLAQLVGDQIEIDGVTGRSAQMAPGAPTRRTEYGRHVASRSSLRLAARTSNASATYRLSARPVRARSDRWRSLVADVQRRVQILRLASLLRKICFLGIPWK